MNTLSMSNNPVVNRKKRYWLLEKRKRRLSLLSRPGRVEYNEEGVASAFYPNLDPRRKKANELKSRIQQEQKQIADWIHKHGYSLA